MRIGQYLFDGNVSIEKIARENYVIRLRDDVGQLLDKKILIGYKLEDVKNAAKWIFKD